MTSIFDFVNKFLHPIPETWSRWGDPIDPVLKITSLFVETILKYTSLGYEVNNKIAFREFDQLRKVDNAAYSFGTLALDKFLSSKNSLVSIFANTGIKILEKNNFVKRKIVESATVSEHFKSL